MDEEMGKLRTALAEAQAAGQRALTEKDDSERKHYEADLRSTRLQSELVSCRKALRQAVQQMEAMQEQQAPLVMRGAFCVLIASRLPSPASTPLCRFFLSL